MFFTLNLTILKLSNIKNKSTIKFYYIIFIIFKFKFIWFYYYNIFKNKILLFINYITYKYNKKHMKNGKM